MSEFNLFVYGTLRGGDPTGNADHASNHGVGADHDAASNHGVGADHRAARTHGPGVGHETAADHGDTTAMTAPTTAHLMAGCVKVADGTVGGTLYDIEGRFPALVRYGSDPVRGEIWRCPADILLALDSYEGTAAGLFRRVGVEIETDGGELLPCWVYTAGPALSRQLTPTNRIGSGTWQPRAR